jgi:hypothetical protein
MCESSTNFYEPEDENKTTAFWVERCAVSLK